MVFLPTGNFLRGVCCLYLASLDILVLGFPSILAPNITPFIDNHQSRIYMSNSKMKCSSSALDLLCSPGGGHELTSRT